MERESFENEEVAALLNRHFVSVKVDREERPDVDTIYMSVCQAMTGHGGWPLTIVMTPDRKPFFAGTYFPRESSRGMPGLTDILHRIADMWKTQKEELLISGDKITRAVESSMFEHARGEVTENTLHQAFSYFDNAFDSQYGGFGRAPKFPTPHNLSFLLRYWKLTGTDRALEMVEKTLDSMYLGGIYDHIGFGFARYSTDRMWLVPHFEKMLYDNALLAIAYLEAFQATGRDKFAKTAREIFTYVLRDMTSPAGAFYSAEDADSESEEGKFYAWTPEEVRETLSEEDAERYCKTYDITPRGNFEGKSIPNLIKTGYIEGLDNERGKLFLAREKRIHPFKDDKVLTGWNGLMIAAMAFGARVLDDDRYAAAAEKAVHFIMKSLRRNDGRLLARYRDGEAAFPAYAEDYAYLIWGLIELFQATFKPQHLKTALELNGDLLKYFWDEKDSGLFHYGSDAENLIARPKEIYDGALPSANSVAALNFLRLARLTGDAKLEELANDHMRTFGGSVNETPMGHTHFLMAAYFNTAPSLEVSVVSSTGSPDAAEMIRTLNRPFAPEMLMIFKPLDGDSKEIDQLVPYLKERTAVDGKATAYVCRNYACQEPVTDIDKLKQFLTFNRDELNSR